MKMCSACRFSNAADALYCEYCGTRLDASIHNTSATPHCKPKLILPDTNIELSLAGLTSVIVGRNDSDTEWIAPIDLSPYGAVQKGVSRKHIQVDINQTTGEASITDLDSVNGVEINGEEIPAGVSQILRNNDQLTLGDFELIYLIQ